MPRFGLLMLIRLRYVLYVHTYIHICIYTVTFSPAFFFERERDRFSAEETGLTRNDVPPASSLVPATYHRCLLSQAWYRRRGLFALGAEPKGGRSHFEFPGEQVWQDHRADLDPVLSPEGMGPAAEERYTIEDRRERERV